MSDVTKIPEGENTKPITIIEYGSGKYPDDRPDDRFVSQSLNYLWEEFEDRLIFSSFTRNLARTYLPGYRHIRDFIYLLDTHQAFSAFSPVVSSIEKQLPWVISAAHGDLPGKTIVDLGCGSTRGTKDADEYGGLFQPWLCRTLLELGVLPIGVDVGESEGEKFETHQVDLLVPNALNFLTDDSIDIVNSRALFTSPELRKRGRESPYSLFGKDIEDYLMKILSPQIIRILKPDGTFVYSRDL